jgi:type I restriction enzyme, R subunit
MHTSPTTKEQFSSHIPALVLLKSLGWRFIPQAECTTLRGGNRELLLQSELVSALQRHRFPYKGKEYPLSENGISQIIRTVSALGLTEGLLTANERFYNMLTLGITVTEFMDAGKKHEVTVPLINWDNVEANNFCVTEEFDVLKSTGVSTRRPDVVCFVNGLPLVVIEAKRPDSKKDGAPTVAEGIRQMLRNQQPGEIPQLFVYSQLVIAISNIDGRYGTTLTDKKFWSRWLEEKIAEEEFAAIKNKPVDADFANALFANRPPWLREECEELWAKEQLPTEQDRLIISLLRPDRLLQFIRFFILYDKKKGKIAARYQQFFGIKALLDRITQKRTTGGREGGVIWHTTGSGKSFTMVFLCKALLLFASLKNCRLFVVTDRKDLEKQLAGTFHTGGVFGVGIASKKHGNGSAKAKSGKQLAKRISKGTDRVLFTLINKFASATKLPECKNTSEDIIVLVDEGHRSHGGENHERMRQALPNAAYVAFTGTPLLKNDKTTKKFGPIVHAYTMQRAVEDETVTPLLYEERKPELDVNETSIDAWFEKITQGFTEKMKSDLKRKFSNKSTIHKAERRIELIAWDIATHFRENFKEVGSHLKGQLACDSKLSAIRYKKYLDETGLVTSRVIISHPDEKEGDGKETDMAEVQKWWDANVSNPDDYEKEALDDFSTDGEPDILIVVDKLLTGFDEPRNGVLYIDKPLKQHNLIQAIARVNRLHEDKQYGLLVDYRGILSELDTTIKEYQDLEKRTQGGFAIEDLEGLYANINTQYKQLPTLHAAVWDFFKQVRNRKDIEQYRQVMMPQYEKSADGEEHDKRQKVREDFYAALTQFSQCLKIALSSRSFFEDKSFTEDDIRKYKHDLKWFMDLRQIIRQDAQETVDYSEYEQQIRRLVDKDVVGTGIEEAEGTILINGLSELPPEEWTEEKTRNETDTIRTRVKRTIEQALGDDPYAQKVFSELLQEAIAEAKKMFDHPFNQYTLFKEFEDKVNNRELDDLPDAFEDNKHAQAYYGTFKLVAGDKAFSDMTATEAEQSTFVEEAFKIDEIVQNAVAENTLNPQGIEAAITQGLLPRLYKPFGMDKAKEIIEQIIHITRVGLTG